MLPVFNLSPDGKKLVLSSREGSVVRVQTLDLASKTLTRLIDNTQDIPNTPVWSSDGRRIFFATFGTHRSSLYSLETDANAQPQRLIDRPGTYMGPQSVSADGRWLVYSILSDAKTGNDLWMIEAGKFDGQNTGRPFLTTSAHEDSAAISPDGRWIAYRSDESGSNEIYIRQFPSAESKRRVSVGTIGNTGPRWSRDGRELFFQAGEGDKMMAVSIQTAAGLNVSEPRVLFEGRFWTSGDIGQAYAIAPDGRFLMIQETEEELSASELVVVTNWFSEIERLSPRKR
jgi:Tol biopolymer transport system component